MKVFSLCYHSNMLKLRTKGITLFHLVNHKDILQIFQINNLGIYANTRGRLGKQINMLVGEGYNFLERNENRKYITKFRAENT